MAATSRQRIGQSVFRLTMILVIGWVLCFWPARLLRGQAGVAWMTVAAICCLIPGWIVMLLSSLAIFSNELAAMLAQSLVRMALVGTAAVAVRLTRPDLGIADFYGWLIVFYLLALVAEVVLIRRDMSGGKESRNDTEGDSSSI